MSLSAAERTAKIIAADIACGVEKQDLTTPAWRQALPQQGLLLENGSNNSVILRNNIANLFLSYQQK